MKAVADFVHSQGLKFGVYTARGSRTCQQRPGSYSYELVDAATYCEWGLDYLKNDNCGGTNWPVENTSWIKFKQGFDKCYEDTGKYIVKSIEYCRDPSPSGCGACTVRDFGGILHPRMPLVPTPVRLKLLHVCDQWYPSRVFTPLTGWHCKLRPNTEAIDGLAWL
jgi:hypothetical protein